MPHVVTQSCCSDASCVFVCPVNCIHPTPDEPGFQTAEMLYIDPKSCVDCSACVPACPVDAIKPHTKLTDDEQEFLSINSDFYSVERERPLLAPVVPPLTVREREAPLRVAVVGSGPAGMYAADEVLTIPGARVNMFERLSEPYGLARWGVAPDHRRTRQVSRQFDQILAQDRLNLFCGVEIGKDLGHEDLLASHHAVIYAVGASSDRRLEVPGVELDGVASATEFVAWYNGHPDFVGRDFDLSHPRVVVIGNGNVALDVARVLTASPESLAGTDIASEALAALRGSGVEEVVVVGRRGPFQSAFTLPEIVGLRSVPGVDVSASDLPGESSGDRKVEVLRGFGGGTGVGRRISLRYLLSPVRIVGSGRVAGVEFERNSLVGGGEGVSSTGDVERIDAGLVLSSIGYRGDPVVGLPFDGSVVPNRRGSVFDPASGADVVGAYVAGWIKRGPSGFIGTNKACARESVGALVEDFNAGRLTAPRVGVEGLVGALVG